jgi:hypothetical protein
MSISAQPIAPRRVIWRHESVAAGRWRPRRNASDNVQRVHRGEKPAWVVPELAHLVR